MTQQSIRELTQALRQRYVRAKRSEKTRILDEFVATTGYHRKHAIRLLCKGRPRKRPQRPGRPRRYNNEVISALITIWEICSRICSRRLHPFLPEIIRVLEACQELELSPNTRQLLLQMSRATIDRLLQPHRPGPAKGRCTTKPGNWLKQAIAIHTFADWDEACPGFVEMDLVAHCGQSTVGKYLHTLNVFPQPQPVSLLPEGEDQFHALSALPEK